MPGQWVSCEITKLKGEKIMSYFQTLKDSITCRDAAERYGLKVDASGMTRCPFHDDHTPSLKLSRGFHCFGCGTQGDVITFVSRLLGISAGDAAGKLSADFGIPIHPRGPPKLAAPDSEADLKLWVSSAKQILHRYYDLLVLWKQSLRCRTLPGILCLWKLCRIRQPSGS